MVFLKKLVKIVFIYRALEIGETKLWCMPFRADILSEVYSRILDTSNGYGEPSLRCFSESFKVAYKYSKKEGYSGEIAVLQIYIWSDGTCTLEKDDTCFIHRLWQMKDWLDIASQANKDSAQNLNYKTEDVPLYHLITYAGQKTVRGVARASMAWVVHTEKPFEYSQILTKEEIEMKKEKRCIYPSLHSINYSFDIRICDRLLECFNKFDGNKAWVKNSKIEIEQIKSKLCIAE